MVSMNCDLTQLNKVDYLSYEILIAFFRKRPVTILLVVETLCAKAVDGATEIAGD